MSQIKSFASISLDPFRKQQDKLADTVFLSLKKQSFNPMMDEDYNHFESNNQIIPDSFPAILKDYFETLKADAQTIDEDITIRGARFFNQYAAQLMATLGFLSLPYCYAAADGAKVLYASQRIRKNPNRRLLETAQFVFDVCAPNGFKEEGKAIISIGKVRLMHAAIRYYIDKSAEWNEAYGMPINQEDMAGTNLAFSLIAIRGLRKLGYRIDGGYALDYIRFWSAIGKLLGIKDELLPDTLKEAVILDKKIARRHFKFSKEGAALTKALKDSIDERSNFAAEGLMTYLLGKEMAELLGLKYSGLRQAAWSGAQGLIATTDLLSSYSKDNFAFAYDSYQKQASEGTLKPFRLLNNLND